MKKLDLKILENADLQIAGRIAELCPAADKKERKKLWLRLEDRLGSSKTADTRELPDKAADDEYLEYEYKLKGANCMKQKWIKPFRTAVIAFVIVGGVLGGIAAVKSMKKDDTPVTSKVTDENGVPILTVAYICENESDDSSRFRAKVSDFNRRNDDYKIEVITYICDEVSTALNKFSVDLADGKVPDIVTGASGVLMPLYRHDYLEDLGELMDEKDGIKRNDIVPSLLKAITFDGEIPLITDEIYLQTYVVRNDRLGKELTNWSIGQAVDFYNSLSDDDKTVFLRGATDKANIGEYFIEGAMLSCIDYREFTFDPENGLRQALEFIYSLPDDIGSYMNVNDHEPSDSLLKCPFVAVSNSYSLEAIGCNGGRDISIVGYPTENGSGVNGMILSSMCIMDSSDYKDMAWDFINKYYFSEDDDYYNHNLAALPLRDSLYQKLYDLDSSMNDSINRGFTNENGAYIYPDGDKFRITDKQKQQLRNYIANLDVCAYHDYELENMIKEECAYVVSGERTPDQCIDILNDRVEKYLAENE